MASTYWIKLYHEILHDPKMCRLSDHLYRRCMELFLQAGETDKDGELPSVDDMAWSFRTDSESMLADLQSLAAVGIVHEKDGVWIVTNFAERQDPDNPAERVDRPRCSYEVWNMIRKAVLRRDRFQCQGCGATLGLNVHHIVPVHRGGEDDPRNLISLCNDCHAAIHPWLGAA